MLTLTRRRGQVIMIDDDIEITVLLIDDHEVRLGFKAPQEVSIQRQEIYKRIKHEQRRAADKKPVSPLEVPVSVKRRKNPA